MKTTSLFVAAGLAIAATVAFAETGAQLSRTDNNSGTVYGRPDVSVVVTRPALEVVAGPTTEEGPVAVAIQAKGLDVNKVQGRS
jgi:hypothetical protein